MRNWILLPALFAVLWGQAPEEVIRARIDEKTRALVAPLALRGTALLTLPGDLYERQHRQIQAYLLKQIAATPSRRDALWRNYPADVAERRARLAALLGSVEPVAGPAQVTLLSASAALRIEELNVPVEGEHHAHAVLLEPLGGAARKPVVIALAPDELAPETFAGIEAGMTPAPWLLDLLARDISVCLPITVTRTTDHPLCQSTRGKDRRHILHRLGFITGRTVTGLEVDQVRALVRYLTSRAGVDGSRIAVLGRGQGGMTALYAAALEERLRAAAVSGYFAARESCWREPVDRMLYGQLLEFGDAEVAALIAPRRLIVDSAEAGELERARRYFARRQAEQELQATAGGFEELAAACAEALEAPAPSAGYSFPDRLLRTEIDERRNRHYNQLLDYLRQRIGASEEIRRRRWSLAATPAGRRAAKAQELVTELRGLVGEIPGEQVPLNARSRLIKITDRYLAFDVLLDVVSGVEAYGQLLVPRNASGQRLPAVVTQHGLGGKPKDLTLEGENPDKVYHGVAARLAEAGYVVFAPYVTVPIPQAELINPLVRQAAALGRMRISIEAAKLRRILDFLQSLDFVDGERLGYYGLSYGGYSATWMGPLEPRLKATVISGHFNDWRRKLTDEGERTSYLLHPDEDFYNWNVLPRFSHVELLASFYPRAVMVEFAQHDATTFPAWHERAWSEVAEIAAAWRASDRLVRDRFDGVHEVHGVGAFDFLDRWLRPEKPSERRYEYRAWPSLRDLPGLGDSAPDTLPYVTHTLDAHPGTWVRGSFRPAQPFTGLAFRLSRTGNPGDLIVRYGSAPGGSDLGVARVAAVQVYPLYDLWIDAPVQSRRLDPGREVWFELRVERGRSPEDFYTLYGPRPLGGARFAGEFAVAFRPIGPLAGEERFEFVRRLLAPWQPPRVPDRKLRRFEIRAPSSPHPALEQAVADLAEFFTASGASIGPGGVPVSLVLERRQEHAEAFRLSVSPGGIAILAGHPRGLLRGVYELEERMLARGSIELEPLAIERRPRFPIRITTSILPGGERYTESSRELLYTDGLLRRISRDGFNGIWVWLNVEEATFGSSIFPELDEPEAARRLRRLRTLAQRAARYGIDVWVYLATGYHRPVPESFYERRPEMRGQGWGNPLCFSQRAVRDYYAETVRTIFREAPELAGLVVIYDSEGFFHCANTERTHQACPRCRQTPRELLTRDLLVLLQDAMRQAGGADKRLIAFNYGYDTRWPARLFPLLPKDIIHQCDFSKGGVIERDGVRHATGDYNLTSLGPPEHWIEQYRLARQLGLPFLAKTEHAVSQEFIFIPYIPAMEQWLARIRKMRQFDLVGWFGNWCHYGYTSSPPARLINRMSWDPAPENVLEDLARQEYGPAAAPKVLEAWRRFSEAIREFPYSDSVARLPGPLQKGPSHPFLLDPGTPSFGRWRAWQNDLGWTKPWGPEITAKYLGRVKDGFEAGAALLAETQAASAEYRIARLITASLATVLNLIDWIQARDRGAGPDELLAILERERQNVESILPLLEADSRLGYASEGGGVQRPGLFTPELVRWKLGQIEDVMFRQIPARFGVRPRLPSNSDLARLLASAP